MTRRESIRDKTRRVRIPNWNDGSQRKRTIPPDLRRFLLGEGLL